MPGRTEKQAHAAFVTPLREVLGCLTWRPLELDEKPIEVGVPKALSLGGPSAPVELDGTLPDGTQPALFVGMDYTIIEQTDVAADQRYRVTTDKYTYHLYSSLGEEVLLYHWHPDTAYTGPHLHVAQQQLSNNPNLRATMHVPTARLALESLALFLIDELGVTPLYPTYRQIIEGHLENFVAHRKWHHERPAD